MAYVDQKRKMGYSGKNIIGIIAGNGELPLSVANSLIDGGYKVLVLAIDGHANLDLFRTINHQVLALGQMKKAIDLLRAHQIKDIIFVGGIARTALKNLKLDRAGIALLFKAGMKKITGGDDGLLSLVLKFFEDNQFKIKSIYDLAPQLIFEDDILGKTKPSSSDLRDIAQGKKILSLLGEHDVGQSIIIENNHVLGIEAAEGTDRLIERCLALKKDSNNSGVLVKIAKTRQDRRVDLPTIGIKTIELLHQCGFKGLALEKGSTIVLNRSDVEKAANQYKIFVVGI